ncbi:MAG: 1-acyl-sn-glycerol-3-phosphate acyltransferase [Tenericutes bacterium]|nr:1-acyl-sn-glycerol-3-phosphate acyltransferase [Mycoplasmatota bacterium]
MSKKIKEGGYKFFKPILGPIFKMYYKPTIINAEAIPKEGPILIVGNHKHLFDQCLAIIATKRVIHYMAKKEYWDSPKTRWFFNMVGCIPVNRQIHDSNAKEAAIEVLKNGGAIGLFPEGTRNKTKEFLLPFKFGAVSMAQKTNATLVPFGIAGDYVKGGKNLVITFGEPFKVAKEDSLEEANEKLRNEVGNLIKKGESYTKK